MDAQLDQFKQFVRKHPGLRDDVRAKKSTWQTIYEEWYLYGEDDSQWKKYETALKSDTDTKEVSTASSSSDTGGNTETKQEGSSPSGSEMMTQAFQYLQKMDMNKVQQTMGTVQQFVKLFQSFSGSGAGGAAASAASAVSGASARDTYPGLFSKFDD